MPKHKTEEEKYCTNTPHQLPKAGRTTSFVTIPMASSLWSVALVYFIFLKDQPLFFFPGPFKHISPSLEAQLTRYTNICKPDLPPCSLSPPSHHDLAASRHPLPEGPLSPLMPLSAWTHHDRDVKNVHLLLHYLRRLLEAGGGCPGELLGAAHGDVEVQGAILQPLLLPVHQRNVSHGPRHLCRDKTHN